MVKQKSCESINYFLNLSLPTAIILYNAVERCYLSAVSQETPKALPNAELLFVIPEGDTYGSQLQETLEASH